MIDVDSEAASLEQDTAHFSPISLSSLDFACTLNCASSRDKFSCTKPILAIAASVAAFPKASTTSSLGTWTRSAERGLRSSMRSQSRMADRYSSDCPMRMA